jgi:glycosyltransferase involved in cell wall biosynthesis
MRGQLAYLCSQGYHVTVIASPGAQLAEFSAIEGVDVVTVAISREMRPFKDLVALFRLILAIRKIRPQVVNASTPKAGLLGMLAAFLLRIPLRIYTLRGLRLETTQGWRRFVLYGCECVASACSHQVVCVSHSLRDAYLKLGCAKPRKTTVFNAGSSNGVDAARFNATPEVLSLSSEIRERYQICDRSPVIAFVGRLTRDKGVADLLTVFERMLKKFPTLHLMVVGEFEDGDCVSASVRKRLEGMHQVHMAGIVGASEIAAYYQACDLLLFPSYREGFPNAVLEAQACSLPVAGYAATGTMDAVENGKTGVIVPVGDADALACAVEQYLADPRLMQSHGRAGRARVLQDFCPQDIWRSLAECYRANEPRGGIHESFVIGYKHTGCGRANAA